MSLVQHVDELLAEHLRKGPLHGVNAQVVFDTPNADWVARRSGPCVNVYLYGIDEDPTRRQSGETSIIDEDGKVVGYSHPHRYFRMSYALTVWAQSVQDEHRMLGTLLEWCVGTDTLTPLSPRHPQEPLSLRLRDSKEGGESPLSRIWTGLNCAVRPALDLLVTVPVGRPDSSAQTPPVEGMTLKARRTDATPGQGPAPDSPSGAHEPARPRRRVEEIA
ncbi:DUF4255 domain-containing protein [Streptomyces sp. H27-C3]|uniref:DUF4255 domain-containing protein n=1 Tax=Streptomyces sp. H27-C3 TaxID=3046305 RepID=UPI0024BA010F|nr:DUF4255 domain-containing protein [Streptomyces sp. H27-C3]MDJ0466206.1 DUF4255 domain-containing protein [Streptomyces sp. H27-C3]